MSASLEATGVTQCVPGRQWVIAPLVKSRVLEVLVTLGQFVKKTTPLVKLDDTAAQARVAAKQAALKHATAVREAAERIYKRYRGLSGGGRSNEELDRVELEVIKARQQESAARAELDAALREAAEHLLVTPIDGVVNRLDVVPGMIAQPEKGWVEIVGVQKEIDVLCELEPKNADRLAVDGDAKVFPDKESGKPTEAKIVFVGLVPRRTADDEEPTIPVLVRVKNAKARYRCGAKVVVRFASA
jgi:RND family efflux transporter MFP subunit